MPYKYRKWKIKWQKDTKKFKKIKRNREKSRDSYNNWRRNKGKMLAALRKSKPQRKLQMKKNKARGMYKKLSIARKRFKNILKSDINLDNMLDGRLFLDEAFLAEEGPSIDIEKSDIEGIIAILKSIQENHKWDDKDDQETTEEFIRVSIEHLGLFKDAQELFDSEENFLEELIAFIDEYAEDVGAFDEIEEE